MLQRGKGGVDRIGKIRQRGYYRKISRPKDGSVVAPGNFDDDRLVAALSLEVFGEALTQGGGMHTHGIIGRCVVELRLAEDVVSEFEFVDVICRLVEHAMAQVKEELS
jgi:hypothetical protein